MGFGMGCSVPGNSPLAVFDQSLDPALPRLHLAEVLQAANPVGAPGVVMGVGQPLCGQARRIPGIGCVVALAHVSLSIENGQFDFLGGVGVVIIGEGAHAAAHSATQTGVVGVQIKGY